MSPATLEIDETSTQDVGAPGRWVTQQIYDPGFKSAVTSQIQGLRGLAPGWDGYSAPRIDEAIVDAALKLVQELAPHIAPRPRVVPLSSGGLQFEWQAANGQSLELEFEDDSTIHYLRWHQAAGIEDEAFLSVDEVEEIEQLIKWFTDRADV